jgi:hypothetical protein
MRPALPVLDDAARSPDPSVCPFLRRDVAGAMTAPASVAEADHVCVAIGGPRPQSTRQQELVCLRASHADCPRYLRGALAVTPAKASRSGGGLPRATVAALLILVLSAGISFGFVVQRGGIAMPVVGPGGTQAAAVDTAAPTGAPASQAVAATATPATASAGPSAETSPDVTPTPTPTPSTTPAPTPTPTPAPTPTPKPTASLKSDRYALLTRCPDRKNCWIYTVRTGDNLYSIANYFGHPLSTIYAWNPQYPGTPLRKGAQIRMPPPTR